MCANIRTKRDLANLCEVSDIKTGAFVRSTFAYVDDEGVAWFGQTADMRKYDLTVEDLKRLLLKRLLQGVPDEKIYPLKPAMISVISEANQKYFYVKRPKLLCLDSEEETTLLPKMLLEEGKVLHTLEQEPHPNIIKFLGCIINRGRLTGIALEKHNVNL
jgi:hypothetical protein